VGNQAAVDFEAYFMALDAEAREAFAARADTTVVYIRDHLLAGRRMPRRRMIDSLAEALEDRGAGITREELVLFFHARSEREATA
jgi:hypothetical protein